MGEAVSFRVLRCVLDQCTGQYTALNRHLNGCYLEMTVTVIHAKEKDKPKGREPIDWKLVTDMPVRTRTEAIEKLRWYALRWKIEVVPLHLEIRLSDRAVQASHGATTR